MNMKNIRRRLALSIFLLFVVRVFFDAASWAVADGPISLLNASYDPTRGFYEEYNQLFANWWKAKGGVEVKIKQSHGGSGKQARSVIDGLPADVVTLALASDIDSIVAHAASIPPDWEKRLPNNSSPYTSTIVFLVRSGNPKAIKDWDDLIKEGVEVITPNPKTSGGARWIYMAAWGYAEKRLGGEDAAKRYITELFKHVPMLDTGARGSTTTFAERGIGDVLLTWENEAYLAAQELGKDKFEILRPSLSILAEPPVAVVEKNALKKATTEVATAYLEHLYSAEAQEICAKHFFRPRDASVLAKHSDKFPVMTLVTIEELGGWTAVQKKHFEDGGVFDQLYQSK